MRVQRSDGGLVGDRDDCVAADLVTGTRDADSVLSPDVPTGRNATTGVEPGAAVSPDRVLTLAVPKTGLTGGDELWLADIATPATVYERLDIPFACPFTDGHSVALTRSV